MNDSLAMLLAVVILTAAVCFALQVMDAVLVVIDARAVRDEDALSAPKRRSFRELFWSLSVTATLAVVVAFGVDVAARLVWDSGQLWAGLGVLLASATVAFLAGAVGVVAILGPERPTYARLRRDLRDRSGQPIPPDEFAHYEEGLRRADQARRKRPRMATILRVIALVFVLIVAGGLAVAFLYTAHAIGWLFVGVTLVEASAFVVALRASAVRRSRLDEVLDTQRAEVVALLERARIPQRGRVPGLRDRVARALAILREKQR